MLQPFRRRALVLALALALPAVPPLAADSAAGSAAKPATVMPVTAWPRSHVVRTTPVSV